MVTAIYRRYKPANEDEKNFLGMHYWELLIVQESKHKKRRIIKQVEMYEKFIYGARVVKILEKFGIKVEIQYG